MDTSVRIGYYQSPCGWLRLGSWGGKLCLCDWAVPGHSERIDCRLMRILGARYEQGSSAVIERASEELHGYFAGERREFDVPLLFAGSDFQRLVWNELMKIPYGQTVSYGDVARRIERPGAVRAVANATGANALSIFVPCHRVIGADKSLTGYAGGMEAKRALLQLEGRG